MKKKLTITIASILSVIVIIGVGFAAWVITNPNVTTSQDGTISVETVTDKSYSLSSGAVTDNIKFGAPQKTSTGWLSYDSDDVENLTATFTLKLTWNDATIIPDLNLKMEALKESGESKAQTDVFATLKDGEKALLANPTISYDSTTPVTVTMNGEGVTIPKSAFGITESTTGAGEKEITVTIKFGWGEFFGNKNPYDYYLNKDYDGYKEEASRVLNSIKTNLTGVSYKVIVTRTTAA